MNLQTSLGDFERDKHWRDLQRLTRAEYTVFMAVEREGYGVREYARSTDRSPGTVGNLLRRAREKLEGSGGES